MLNQPTVLVLGAGASRPYGIPTASELRDWMLGGTFRPRHAPDAQVRAIEQFARIIPKIADAHGIHTAFLKAFQARFFQSQRTSVDAFIQDMAKLEPTGDDEHIGKTLLAAAILHAESQAYLDGGWYQQLLEAIRQKPAEQWGNNLSVITFNYDRSFELFFRRSLRTCFGPERGLLLFQKIRICHVYGSLGALEGDERAVLWGDLRDVTKARPNIRLTRAGGNSEYQAWMDTLLAEAGRIVFLGFAFSSENLMLLRLPENLPGGRKEIIASAYGLPETTKRIAEKHFQGAADHVEWGGPKETIPELISRVGF